MIQTLRDAIESGATSSRALVESCLERATAASGEGSRTFVHLFADAARAEADAIDGRRRAGIWTGVLGGIPISVKDLFDIRGLPTTAGSTALADAPGAKEDAVVVQWLRAAGAVIVGRTNMTEFAFSGLGLNPHYGTLILGCSGFRLRRNGGRSDRHRYRRIGSHSGRSLRFDRLQTDPGARAA
jgi:aspartyl-tRNA(Asn)/glutamyl-tRNA(Gln) amidotransferase subunit A